MQATAKRVMGGGFRRNSVFELKLKNRCTGSTFAMWSDIIVSYFLLYGIDIFLKTKGSCSWNNDHKLCTNLSQEVWRWFGVGLWVGESRKWGCRASKIQSDLVFPVNRIVTYNSQDYLGVAGQGDRSLKFDRTRRSYSINISFLAIKCWFFRCSIYCNLI